MRYAYADPPYLGCGAKLYSPFHGNAADWDDPQTHRDLVSYLVDEFPDGWAISLHTPSLRLYTSLAPDDARVGAWVKPFASFKPGVNPAYAWEPVLFRGGRKRSRTEMTVRDWVSVPIELKRGLPGAKPLPFCRWILDLLGYRTGDEVVDLFPGTGAMAVAERETVLELSYE